MSKAETYKGGPKRVSFFIALLALYGDLLKRILAPSQALVTLYLLTGLVLFLMLVGGRSTRGRATTDVSSYALGLITVYVCQLLTTTTSSLIDAISVAAYVSIPLLFLVVIPRYYAAFDLIALARHTIILSVPLTVVACIQYFVDPSFLISTSYAGTSGIGGAVGGVIERNFLSGGMTFHRYPSLFVSADRYAGVAMIQFLFAAYVLKHHRGHRGSGILGVAGLIMSMLALVVAGARSRILICTVAVAVTAVVFARARLSGRLGRHTVIVLVGASIIALAVGLFDTQSQVTGAIGQLPIVRMLNETLEQRDVNSRAGQSFLISQMPEEVTLFGEGLGTAANGRTGEFGVRVMWIESGLLWTLCLLLLNVGISANLVRTLLINASNGEVATTPLATAQAIAWPYAILAGLASSYELTQALLLFPAIAVLTSRPHRST